MPHIRCVLGQGAIAPRRILICVSDYADTAEELALRGFRPDDKATIVNVEYRQYSSDLVAVHGELGHAIVQVVGFPGKSHRSTEAAHRDAAAALQGYFSDAFCERSGTGVARRATGSDLRSV